MKAYSQLSLDERYILAGLKARRVPVLQIAKLMGRHPSTIYRETSRNLRPSGFYAASVADSYAKARCHSSRRGSHYGEQQWALIVRLLRQQWSPEQISGTLRALGVVSISAKTIYRMIRKRREKGDLLYRQLRICSKLRKKSYRSEDYCGRLKGKRPISERPQAANERTEVGHWEADTVMGANQHECILTVVERKTGFAQMAKIRRRSAREVNTALAKIIAANRSLFRTITFDNGTEFHSYKKLEKRFGVTCYFATPHSPWERGTNENFNGLVRQYFPKRSTLADVGDAKLAFFSHLLNTRPRKRHGFKSPQEVLYGCASISHLVG
jgi:IS30 family transposase